MGYELICVRGLKDITPPFPIGIDVLLKRKDLRPHKKTKKYKDVTDVTLNSDMAGAMAQAVEENLATNPGAVTDPTMFDASMVKT